VSVLDSELHEVFDCLSREPFFCGYRLARLREKKGQTPEQQADDLGITLQRLMFLALSRLPQGRTDLEALAWQLEMEPGILADMLGEPRVKGECNKTAGSLARAGRVTPFADRGEHRHPSP
jgi:hypothetical protein